jgi:hypothetical protein
VRTLGVLSVALVAAAQIAAGQSARGGRPAQATPPDLQGIWQVLNNAAQWDVEPHTASWGVPAGLGVIVDPPGGTIPYLPAALATRRDNFQNRAAGDPLAKCFKPGVPRITYLPFPFQIVQSAQQVSIFYEYVHNYRTIHLNRKTHLEGIDFWNGDSIGHWEGNTLVVDVANFNDQTWFDGAGNFHSDALHVVERYTRSDANTIAYEATIEDPKVFSRSWTIRVPLHLHREPNFRILEYECHAYAEDAVKEQAK